MRGLLQGVRQKIIDRDYYLSAHAEEEMAEDDWERPDIENAILKRRIQKKLTEDPNHNSLCPGGVSYHDM